MEKAPHKKEDLTIANHVLKLASKLLKVTLSNSVLFVTFTAVSGVFLEGTYVEDDSKSVLRVIPTSL